MVIGVLRAELHLPMAQSLKDKRSVVKRLRDQIRARFNVAVAEVEPSELWQRATLGLSAVGEDHGYVAGLLREVAEWLRADRAAAVIRIEEEYL